MGNSVANCCSCDNGERENIQDENDMLPNQQIIKMYKKNQNVNYKQFHTLYTSVPSLTLESDSEYIHSARFNFNGT